MNSTLIICLIIFVIMIVGFCSGKYSLATISLAAMMALVLTGCITADTAIGYFANTNVIMIAGMCVVAAGFNRTSFCLKLADAISGIAKGSLNKLMLGYVIIGVLLSQFIQSPIVVMGIVAPMLLASAESMGFKSSKVVFPVTVATICTCCTLPLGAGATVAAELNGYLESYGYTTYTVGLTDPALGRFPLMIIAIFFCALILPKFCPDEPDVKTTQMTQKKANREPLGKFQEIAGIVIFFGDALALMFASTIGLANWEITVIGALLMVLCGVLKPKEATASLPMSMLLLIVGALAMAGALSSTGAGDLIGSCIGGIAAAVNYNSYIVGFMFFIIPFVLTQVMQNRGTMLIFHPIAIATCASIGANPVGLMILIQAACLSAFMTPMATPAVPYAMEIGGYSQATMFKMSWLLSIVCCVVSVLWIMTMFPLF